MTFRYQLHRVKNVRFPEEKPVYSVSLVRSQNISSEKIASRLSADSSFTEGDMTGIIDNLIIMISEYLTNGYTVTLDGLGTFSVSAELKEPVTDPETVTGNHIQVKRICFKPAPGFKRRVERDASFERYTPPIRYISEEEAKKKDTNK